MKRAVSEAPTVCCFDYKVTPDHHDNWKKAYQELMKRKVQIGSDSDDEIDEKKVEKSRRLLKQKDTGCELGKGKNMNVIKKKSENFAQKNKTV